MTRTEADDALRAMFATQSDIDAQRRAEGLLAVLALIPINALAWAYALRALASLLEVL